MRLRLARWDAMGVMLLIKPDNQISMHVSRSDTVQVLEFILLYIVERWNSARCLIFPHLTNRFSFDSSGGKRQNTRSGWVLLRQIVTKIEKLSSRGRVVIAS